jgi:NAD(P)-dependent dehydrogenase (short-subunit alcohol dehydrogenase family)
MDLKGVVALVTGGNGGLGQRICRALAQEGAHVAVMYARSRDQAESVVRLLLCVSALGYPAQEREETLIILPIGESWSQTE